MDLGQPCSLAFSHSYAAMSKMPMHLAIYYFTISNQLIPFLIPFHIPQMLPLPVQWNSPLPRKGHEAFSFSFSLFNLLMAAELHARRD